MQKPKNIIIQFIPHKDQRYETCGDWFYEGDSLIIYVSALSDWKRSALVAIHELVEVVLCNHAGITQEQVDKFDEEFERARERGLYTDDEEPGDHPASPYRVQHGIATGVERILASVLGIIWR